jgi:hypothetical protein
MKIQKIFSNFTMQSKVMKAFSKILIFLLLMGFAFFYSCKKPETYPVIPAIQFESFTKIQNLTGKDEKGILKISFTDGDGDIGLAPEDTLAPYNSGSKYYYNFFIDYYEKQNGTYAKVNLPMTNNSRIPVITPDGETKSVKGDIEVVLFINNLLSDFDTIYYEASICDRALHVSNVIKTPDIIIKK